MKHIRFLVFLCFLCPVFSRVALATGDDFTMAAQLLAAAKNANTQQIQMLVNAGADVNYVDATGLSIVCTAVMNNDRRAVQVLQMYGADASGCDKQIKQYKNRNVPQSGGGVLSGLSSTQMLGLGVGAAAVVVGGLYLLTDVFGSDDDKVVSGGGTSGSGGNSGSSGTSVSTPLGDVGLPYGPAMTDATAETENYVNNLNLYSPSDETSIYAKNFVQMNLGGQNYLLMTHGYSPLARGYLGQATLRYDDRSPVPDEVLRNYSVGGADGYVTGGRPVNVALVTANGINVAMKPDNDLSAQENSLDDRLLVWSKVNGTTVANAEISNISSKYYNNKITLGGTADTYVTAATTSEDSALVDKFDLSGAGTAVQNTSATDYDNLLAKVVGGSDSGYANADFFGFMPNGQMLIYRTGGGKDASDTTTDYKNYAALLDAAQRSSSCDLGNGRSCPSVIANIDVIEPLQESDVKTIADLLAAEDREAMFATYVNSYYDDTTTAYSPGANATTFFTNLGSSWSPIVIFSTGAEKTTSGTFGATKEATFENGAPLVYDNLEHLFMSVVAVSAYNNGATASSVSGYTPVKYVLSEWQSEDESVKYRARRCGNAGKGSNGLDPWCFSSPGVTDELAVATAAGAVGAIKGAFNYLNNKQVYMLLALTADGPYLGAATDGTTYNEESLTSYLKTRYVMPAEYDITNMTDSEYLNAFKEVFGYGVMDLERATKPTTNIYFYANNKIVSSAGNAYWGNTKTTSARTSSVLGGRSATIKMSVYDVLTSVDGTMSLPRVWENNFTLGETDRHGLYMGDVLGDLNTRDSALAQVQFGDIGLSMAVSERAYNDNMNGLDNMRFDYSSDNWNMALGYQHYLTDGVSRFYGAMNPIMGLASNAITSDIAYKTGGWTLSGRAFSGAITEEGLLENDPTVTAQFEPARLGNIFGGASGVAWHGDLFDVCSYFGFARETNTVLGSRFDGLLELSGGNTAYVDTMVKYRPFDSVELSLRGTLAQTRTDATGAFLSGVDDLYSNAFSAGVNIGNLGFVIARPLAVTRGALYYTNADYEITGDDNHYDLIANNVHEAKVNLGADIRETRLSATYRHRLGEFTDGALGFIYRINPNNTDAFGNESIFMMKLSHKVGI